VDLLAADGNTVISTFSTIQACANVVSAGQTCLVYEGVYDETVVILRSGTSMDRINFRGLGNVYVNRIIVGEYDNPTGADYITLDNLIIGSNSYSGYGVVYVNRRSDNVIVNECTIDGHNIVDSPGISLFGNNGLMENSIVQNIDDTYAVSVGEGDRRDGLSTENITVTNNVIQNSKDTDAFRVHGINHTISHNEVRNVVRDDYVDREHPDFVQWFTNDNDCAHSYDVRNILIENNYVHDIESQVWYGNNICQNEGSITDNIIFRNNIFYRVGMMSQDHGENLTNLKIYNNIFDEVGYMYYMYGTQRSYSTYAISFGPNSTGVEVKNNVFLNCSDTPSSAYQGCYSTTNPSGLTASNNYCAGSEYSMKAAYHFNEFTGINGGDPKFVNETSQDYRLLNSSPLIDAGVDVGLPYLGNAPDIGVYEYETVQSLGICSAYPGERYSNEEISVQIVRWRSGEIDLREMIKRAKIWKYCPQAQ
jgi:hypothetical protein